MKAVITKACPEQKWEVGTPVNVTEEQFDLLEKDEMAVRASVWEAQQATIKAQKRVNDAAESAVVTAISAARLRGALLPKEEDATIKATAMDLELSKPGLGVAYVGNLPKKTQDDNLTARQTQSGEVQTSTVRGCEQSLGEMVQGYVKASEPYLKTWKQGGLIRCCGTGGSATRAIMEATEAANSRATFIGMIQNKVKALGGDAPLQELVKAASYNDPGSTSPTAGQGMFNSDLVMTWNLGHIENMLPQLNDISTDVENQPVLFMQEAVTRYIIVPGYQKRTNLTTAAWGGNVGNARNANVQMNNYIGIPISIMNTILASTYRQLFNEQKTVQIYGLCEGIIFQIVNAIVNGTQRIENDGTVTNGKKFAPGYIDPTLNRAVFNVKGASVATFLAELPRVMNMAKMPGGQEPEDSPDVERFAWLHPDIYSLLPADSGFVLNQTLRAIKDAIGGKSNGNDLIKTGNYHRVGNVKYSESQLMTDTLTEVSDGANPPNYSVSTGDSAAASVLGFAGTRNSLLFVSRAPLDYTKVMPEIPSTAAVEIVMSPKLRIPFLSVKFLDHNYEMANMHLRAMFGVGVGDERQGIQCVVK